MKQKVSELTSGGLVVGQTKDGKRIYYTKEDTHSLVIGATRSGKTRTLVLPSIGLTAMASMKWRVSKFIRPISAPAPEAA